jgi:hypothetical protein
MGRDLPVCGIKIDTEILLQAALLVKLILL